MPVDVAAAERFVLANARLLDRHRFAALCGGPTAPALAALRAYRNEDGGFGHALEPDVRAPCSEPTATAQALDILLEVGAVGDPMLAAAADWVAGIAGSDGSVPFVLPTAVGYPRAPWMEPAPGGSHLTFAFAAALTTARHGGEWLERATAWCWNKLEDDDRLSAYWVKFALSFVDSVADASRAEAALDRLRPLLETDGSITVPGGADDERLTPLMLAPHPDARSRALFTREQVDADLERVQGGQEDDGGWGFDWLAWSSGQEVEWRGAVTVWALATLREHGRIDVAEPERTH